MRVPQRNHHAVPTSFPNILQCRATQRMFMRSQGVPNEPNRMAQHAIVRGGMTAWPFGAVVSGITKFAQQSIVTHGDR